MVIFQALKVIHGTYFCCDGLYCALVCISKLSNTFLGSFGIQNGLKCLLTVCLRLLFLAVFVT
jgi:hypothetical protein